MSDLLLNSEWKVHLDRAKSKYGVLAADASSEESVARSRRGLDVGVDFAPPSVADALQEFRPQNAEILLMQAGEYFERAFEARSTARSLQIERMRVRQEIEEFLRLHSIYEEEVKAGILDRSALRTKSDLSSELASKSALDEALKIIVELHDIVSSTSAEHIRLARLTAINGAPNYPETRELAGKYIDEPRVVIGLFEPGRPIINDPFAPTFPSESWLRAGILAEEAEKLRLEQATRSIFALMKQAEASAAVNTSRISSLEELASIESQISGFEKRRANIALEFVRERLAAYTTEGGVLDYDGMLKPIHNRYNEDVLEAYKRILVASVGLKGLYGYDNPLPSIEVSGGVDLVFDWLRSTIHWINRKSFLDQSDTYVVYVAEDSFYQSRAVVDLPMRSFQTMVRLRGISAFVHDQSFKPYRIKVSPPRSATYRSMTEDGFFVTRPSLDQSWLKTLWIPQARSVRVPIPPDVVGGTMLNNCSPFGTWIFQIEEDDRELDSRQFAGVEIHFRVSFRS